MTDSAIILWVDDYFLTNLILFLKLNWIYSDYK